ncbi:MAG TPA: class I SAM-dependent methyltransferase [Solirubrobacteraceae bacterium]|jgi:SAM-dependent methyltransferase|nr:class I SAM-dependent methyltransferase [Solirubrobacteraceae bacterium]
MDRYEDVNRDNWDERAPAHAASADYAVERFASDPSFISDVVRFDLPRLGDVSGLRGVHLQCHIGTDTVSLARLGARMTGLDFSAEAIAQARRLASVAGADVEFVQAELYEALSVLESGTFELVFTGIGAICWLPSIARWAEVVSGLLAPGGRLFIREGHPMLWALEDTREDRLLVVGHPYFETPEPTVWDGGGTYVETDVQFAHNRSYNWNHGLGEIVTALFDVGLELTMLVEHDSAPWDALPGMSERDELGEWRLKERPERLVQTYTLQAVKRARA